MKEQISAFMDNELSEEEALRLLKAMKNDDALTATWDAFHQLGDTLHETPVLSADFNQRLAQRLAAEPTILAPQRERPQAPARRFPYPMAAAVAAVSLVGVLAAQIARVNLLSVPAQVATAPAPQAALQPVLAQNTRALAQEKSIQVAHNPAPATPVKFARMTPNAYMLAHQEFVPSYTPAYVRVVTATTDNDQ